MLTLPVLLLRRRDCSRCTDESERIDASLPTVRLGCMFEARAQQKSKPTIRKAVVFTTEHALKALVLQYFVMHDSLKRGKQVHN